MQTFVPYASFDASAAVLDDARLGKQRVETLQILRALVFPSYKGWKNHPATAMWRGFIDALVSYGIAMCDEWERRGRADAVRLSLLEFGGGAAAPYADLRSRGRLPLWWGRPAVHESHRSALVRKLPDHYGPLFPDADPEADYHWPAPLFPRWPAETDELPPALQHPGRTLWVHGHPYDDRVPSLAVLRPPVVDRPPGKVSPSIARPPTAEDLEAMRREATTPPTLHVYPVALLRRAEIRSALPSDPAMIVLDHVTRLPRFLAHFPANVIHLAS